ncbi:hypothetical protein HUJ04_004710 [Dendroctonus ponderosae]|nr:hypothetical protein HUJ04_004710 [Dendroctonus ponderosae]
MLNFIYQEIHKEMTREYEWTLNMKPGRVNKYCFVAFFAFVAVANAGNLVLPSARIIQGPSSRTTVVGPDGSAISSVAPGGQIIQEESAGVVAHSAPVVAAPALAYSSLPLAYAAHSSPIVSAYSSPLVSGVPVVSAYSAPVLSGVEDTVVAGPSGTIISGRSVAAPLVSAW